MVTKQGMGWKNKEYQLTCNFWQPDFYVQCVGCPGKPWHQLSDSSRPTDLSGLETVEQESGWFVMYQAKRVAGLY